MVEELADGDVEGGAEARRRGAATRKMRRIENLSNRQVTFSKRRTGLLKKAYELSVLCDAQLAVIVFSATGRLSEFASPSMRVVVERYEDSMGIVSTNTNSPQNVEYWQREAMLLKNQIDFLQLQQSFLLGENITSIQCVKELDILEQKLCIAIEKVKERKVELFESYAHEMWKKELCLRKENDLLKLQIADVESGRDSWRVKTSLQDTVVPAINKPSNNSSDSVSVLRCSPTTTAPACNNYKCGMANFLQLGLSLNP